MILHDYPGWAPGYFRSYLNFCCKLLASMNRTLEGLAQQVHAERMTPLCYRGAGVDREETPPAAIR